MGEMRRSGSQPSRGTGLGPPASSTGHPPSANRPTSSSAVGSNSIAPPAEPSHLPRSPMSFPSLRDSWLSASFLLAALANLVVDGALFFRAGRALGTIDRPLGVLLCPPF